MRRGQGEAVIGKIGLFWLGYIVCWHHLGRYDIAEYHPCIRNGATITDDIDESRTWFMGHIDGGRTSSSWPTLERAITGLIAIAYDGYNSDAATYFARMIGLPEGDIDE